MCFSGVQGTTSRLEITEMIRLDVPFYVAVMVALWPVNVIYNERNNTDSFIYAEAVMGSGSFGVKTSPSLRVSGRRVCAFPNTDFDFEAFGFCRWDLDLVI